MVKLFTNVVSFITQILHAELEASLLGIQSDLAATEADLQKQRVLNEKLENDLLQMDSHRPNGDASGAGTPDLGAPSDALAGLDLGKKSTVGF